MTAATSPQLGATTSAMAFAALGAVATVSGIRYWAAGLTGSGGLEALEGLARTVGAALFIVLWPWLFRHAADLANAAGSGLLGSGSVLDDTARLLAVAFVAGVAFNILAILIAIGAAVLFLALLLTKIAVSATTALVFVGMPLAVMLWPIPELAWIARTAMRAFAVVLAIPLLWAVCFATFAAVGDRRAGAEGRRQGRRRARDAARRARAAVADGGGAEDARADGDARRPAAAGSRHATASYSWRGAPTPRSRRRSPTALGGKAGGAAASAGEPRRAARQRRTGPGRAGSAAPHRPSSAGSARARTAGPPAPRRQARRAPAAASRRRRSGGWRPPEGFEQAARAHGAGARGTGLRNPSWREIRDHVPVELAAAAARERVHDPRRRRAGDARR